MSAQPNLFNLPEHVGLKGDKVKLRLRFTGRYEAPHDNGYMVFFLFRYFFRDEAGNRLYWQTNVDKSLTEDQWYSISCEIESHGRTTRGVKVTRIKNCRFK